MCRTQLSRRIRQSFERRKVWLPQGRADVSDSEIQCPGSRAESDSTAGAEVGGGEGNARQPDERRSLNPECFTTLDFEGSGAWKGLHRLDNWNNILTIRADSAHVNLT